MVDKPVKFNKDKDKIVIKGLNLSGTNVSILLDRVMVKIK